MRFVLPLLILTPAAALAAPVTLDFQGGEDSVPGNDIFSGAYTEEGFEIAVQGSILDEELAEEFGEEPGVEPALPLLLDTVPTGLFPQVVLYSLSTVDGAPFDLLSLNLDSARSNEDVTYVVEFEDGTSLTETLDSQTIGLLLTGQRTDGSTLETVVDIFDGVGVPFGEEETTTDLTIEAAAVDADLTSLESLEISIYDGFSLPGFDLDPVCDARNLARREDPSVGVPLTCDPDAEPGDGVSSIDGFFADAGQQNNVFTVGVDGFTVAPVPVPAALPLLAGGLGALAWIGRRRR